MNIFHDPSGTIWIRVYIAQITQIPTLVTSSTGENRDYLFGNKSPSCFSPSHWKAPFTALPGRANSEGFALEASWRFQFQTDHVFAWRKSSGNVAKQWNIHDLRSIYIPEKSGSDLPVNFYLRLPRITYFTTLSQWGVALDLKLARMLGQSTDSPNPQVLLPWYCPQILAAAHHRVEASLCPGYEVRYLCAAYLHWAIKPVELKV